jgi:SAM-dependent methyltransferase
MSATLPSSTLASDHTLPSADSCPVCGSGGAVPWLLAPDRFHGRKETYQLVRCMVCPMVWLRNPPKPEEMSYHYGEDYHKLITAAGEVDAFKRWRIPRNRVLSMIKGGSLLDLGCSSGAFLGTLKGGSWKLHGIEISPEEARAAEARSGAQVFVGEILDAPFAPNSFDVITCFHVLEHVYDPPSVVSKVWDWLKPGGFLYILIPNIDSLEARAFRSYWYGLELPRHLHHFSPISLKKLLSHNHFQEVLVRTPPDCYVENSICYVLDDLFSRCGILRRPLATPRPQPSLLWRIIRKGYRMGILWPFRQSAALIGRGSAIEAIFRKAGAERVGSRHQ